MPSTQSHALRSRALGRATIRRLRRFDVLESQEALCVRVDCLVSGGSMELHDGTLHVHVVPK